MLSAEEKLIISRFAGVSEKAFIGAKGKRDSGESVPFAPIHDDDTLGPERTAPRGQVDGRSGGRRGEDAPRGSGVPDNEQPSRLDGRDGERDGIADAMAHLMAVNHDEPDVDPKICSGPGCEKDHEREAHEALRRHMNLRDAEVGRHAMFRFER